MDILVIKISDGKLGTNFKVNQDYSNVNDMVTAFLLRFHPGKTATAYALCDARVVQDQIVRGKSLVVGEITGGGDFDVIQKSAVVAQTIIPPSGIVEGDLDGTDDVVVYT